MQPTNKVTAMSRTFVMLCACMLILGGCVNTTKTRFTNHYALDGSTSVASGARPTIRQEQKVLKVSRISVPPWLEGTAMYYRLDYRNDNRLATYGRSDWIAPPATLLENLVQNTITDGGGWRAVVGPGSAAMADADLHLKLEDFSQTFIQPDQSAGIIEATATLVDGHDGDVLAQKHFRIKIAASTADAQGGAKALSKASRQFAARLAHWLQTIAIGTKKTGDDQSVRMNQRSQP